MAVALHKTGCKATTAIGTVNAAYIIKLAIADFILLAH